MSDETNSPSVEKTLEVVSHILVDADFAAEVVAHNGWIEALDQKDVAVLFLASRFQWAVGLLSVQTATLRRELDELAAKVENRVDQ